MQVHDVGLCFLPIETRWFREFGHGENFSIMDAARNVVVVEPVDLSLCFLSKLFPKSLPKPMTFGKLNPLVGSIELELTFVHSIKKTAVDTHLIQLGMNPFRSCRRTTVWECVVVVDFQLSLESLLGY